MTQKISENDKKDTDHDHSNKYITTEEFNKLTAEIKNGLCQLLKKDPTTKIKAKTLNQSISLKRKSNFFMMVIFNGKKLP